MSFLQNLNSNLPKPQPALGRTYYLVIPRNCPNLEQIIWDLETLLVNNKKIRILWDEPTVPEEINCELIIRENLTKLKQEKLPNLVISDYKTVFYLLNKKDVTNKITDYPIVNWQNYSDFQCQKISPNSSEIDIVENFFLNSNGSVFLRESGKTQIKPNQQMQEEILKQLPTALQSLTNSIFLVSSKSQSNYVGAFSLLRVNFNEIQLHYTSGISTLKNFYDGKKMPILMAAMLDLFQNNELYKDVQLLTFSNKDPIVSQLYQSLGFEIFPNRKCLIVKNNLQEVDLK